MAVDDPWPIAGTITPKQNGYGAKLGEPTEYLTEGDVDHLQAAVDRARSKYGNGKEVGVVFRGHQFEGCSGWELTGRKLSFTVDGMGPGESEAKPKRVFSCPACESRATVRATTNVSVTLDCQDGHPVQELVEQDEVT